MSTIPADALPASELAARALAPARARLQSIDVLRGLVIVLMTLDHVRDFFTDARFDPLDLTQTDPALFMTRWITHLCAPTFIFLAGVSAYLLSKRYEPAELRRHLLTRGAWLIVLEFTVVHFGWTFNLRYEAGLILQVIWAIGASMILLAALVQLPRWSIAAIAMTLMGGHNLLDGIAPETFGALAPLWTLLHVQAQTSFGFVLYPLIPWVGVMALGFVAGRAFDLPSAERRKLFAAAGGVCLAAFIVLRALNGYGDPHAWAAQDSAVYTLLAFITVHKYPPSLMYLLVMLGIALLLLAWFETVRGRASAVLQTFGSVPLFVYVLHIWLAHLLAGVLASSMGFGSSVLTSPVFAMPQGWGFELPLVYLAWAVVLLILYPACRWFAAVKRRRRDWWLAYL